MHPVDYPFDPHVLLRSKKALKRQLLEAGGFMDKRVAILGGSTTAEVRDMLELFLLRAGIRAEFYETEYNQYYEALMFENPALQAFKPDLIYLHTNHQNIRHFPAMTDSPAAAQRAQDDEYSRFELLWLQAKDKYNCAVIQNNFELPYARVLGNLDAVDPRGRTRFTLELNRRFAEYAAGHKDFYLHDLHSLAAWFGMDKWHDRQRWHLYKYGMAPEAIPYVAHSLAGLIKAIYGKAKKCLILDLDNTLWGGVIGDDGLSGIQIGKETPEGEAFTEFQQYVKDLRSRGVLLAVCSKNDPANAMQGFSHPDSVLKLDDFSAFLANWDPKHLNVQEIARTVNLGIDSFVFVDDNPAEREIVSAQLPQVEVPNVGNDVVQFLSILDRGGFFETVSLSDDDLMRNVYYLQNNQRENAQATFSTYDDFLRSLDMKAEIRPFAPLYLDRITQLINKSNQFNLTTRRYTQAEIEALSKDPSHVCLYGRLADKFGDNGLISVVIGGIKGKELRVDLWVMSCRVLKRGMEDAMLDRLIEEARGKGVETIRGFYLKTAKNQMVEKFWETMGFELVQNSGQGDSEWLLRLPAVFEPRNRIIEVEK